MIVLTLGWALLAQDTPATAQGTVRSTIEVATDGVRMVLRDFDGDGRLDLATVDATGFALRVQHTDGSFADEPDLAHAWSAKDVAWCVRDADGDGTAELAWIADRRDVRIAHVTRTDEALALAVDEPLLSAPTFLPGGVHHVDFLRDVDGDGRLDLVLPRSDHFAIHLCGMDATPGAPIEVRLQTDIERKLGDPRDPEGVFRERVRIPWFRLTDVDGDGANDLVAETAERVFFHLAGPTLPATPTWTLDLEALRNETPGDDIDLDDLLSVVGRGVDWRVLDLDGEGANELLLRIGGKFRIYRGGARTGPAGTPHQVLRSSGNVLAYLVRDVDGDGGADLQLLRSEELPLSRLLTWLVLPGELDLTLFTYRNERGKFTSRPVRRNTIAFSFPRLLTLAERAEALEKRIEESAHLVTNRAALDADGLSDDVLDVDGAFLVVYRDAAAEAESQASTTIDEEDDVDGVLAMLLGQLDELGDGGRKELDLGDLDRWFRDQGVGLREAVADRAPDERLPLAENIEVTSIHALDLDGDERPDFLVAGRRENRRVFQFLVRNDDGSNPTR